MKLCYIQTRSQLVAAIEEILAIRPRMGGADTETTGLDCHRHKLRLIQLAVGEKVYVVDCFKVKDYAPLINNLFQQLKDTTLWIGHNLKFEIKMFWANGIELTGLRLFDTQLATNLIDAGLSELKHSLEAISERYAGLELDKSEQKSDWSIPELSRQQLIYAAKDAAVVLQLCPILQRHITIHELQAIFDLEMRVLLCTAAMEFYGAKLDLEKLEALRPYYEEREQLFYHQFLEFAPNRYMRYGLFDELVDQGFSIRSSSQVLEILQSLNVPDPLEKASVIQSTGADVIKLLDWNDYPVLDALGNHRKVSKLLSAYIYSLPELVNPTTGRLHTEYRQMVSTGRFSSSNPNLQQLPRPVKGSPSIRSCFVPEPGWVLVDADYSQIELRVMAEICEDENMLDEFLSGKDPYASTAAYIHGIDYSQMLLWKTEGDPRYKDFRQKSKPVRLGYNYGMGYRKFRLYAKQQYGQSFTLREAERNRNTYFTAYRRLPEYHERFADKRLREARTLKPFYRRRQWAEYPGIPGMCNFPIQGTSGDIQKLAMATLYERLYEQGYSPLQSQKKKLILTVHDELVGECTEDLGEEMIYDIETAMVSAGEHVIKKCPITAEAKIMYDLSQKE